MKQTTISKGLKAILAVFGLCGLVVCFFILPGCGRSLAANYPEFSGRYWPWLIFLWAAGAPCYAALAQGWKISSDISKAGPFSIDNAARLKWISRIAAGDASFFLVGNMILLFANMNHPGVVLLSLCIFLIGLATAFAFAILSQLVKKAAMMQEQCELTI